MFFEAEDHKITNVLFPGDNVTSLVERIVSFFPKHNANEPFKIKLGPGIVQRKYAEEDFLVANRSGHFNDIKGRRFWISSRFNYVQIIRFIFFIVYSFYWRLCSRCCDC